MTKKLMRKPFTLSRLKIYLLRRDRMLGKPEDIVLIKNPTRVSPRKTKLALNRKISVCRYVK
jgi:hypothetical protein